MSDNQYAADKGVSIRRMIDITRRDLKWGFKSFVLNSIGGSGLMPRAGRYGLLKMYGADVRTTGILGGWTLEGNTRNLHIGEGCFFNTRTYLESVGEIHIGRNVGFAMEVMVLTSDHGIDADGRWLPEATPRPVVIEDGAWIGARVTILPGVTIGEGTVIAAGAVVTKDCEPWSLYGGVPARRIRGLRDSRGTRSSFGEQQA